MHVLFLVWCAVWIALGYVLFLSPGQAIAVTRFEWQNDRGEKHIEYFSGDISNETVLASGYWPATEQRLVNRKTYTRDEMEREQKEQALKAMEASQAR